MWQSDYTSKIKKKEMKRAEGSKAAPRKKAGVKEGDPPSGPNVKAEIEEIVIGRSERVTTAQFKHSETPKLSY